MCVLLFCATCLANKDVYKDRSRGCLNVSPLEMKQEIDITVIRKRFPRLLSLLHVRVINFRIVLRSNASVSCSISNYFLNFLEHAPYPLGGLPSWALACL